MAGVSQGGKHLDEAELKKRFDAIDTSGDGSLDAEELGEVFKSLGTDASPTLVANLVRLADADGNGTIEWDEFLSIFKVLEKMKANQAAEREEKLVGAVQPTAGVGR